MWTVPLLLAGQVTKGHCWMMGGRSKRNQENKRRGDIYNGREKISGSNNRLPSHDHGDQVEERDSILIASQSLRCQFNV